ALRENGIGGRLGEARVRRRLLGLSRLELAGARLRHHDHRLGLGAGVLLAMAVPKRERDGEFRVRRDRLGRPVANRRDRVGVRSPDPDSLGPALDFGLVHRPGARGEPGGAFRLTKSVMTVLRIVITRATERHFAPLANRTTLPHFSVSSASTLANSAGVPGSVIPPVSASRAFMVASANAALISRLSRSTISVGVPRGAPIPVTALAS